MIAQVDDSWLEVGSNTGVFDSFSLGLFDDRAKIILRVAHAVGCMRFKPELVSQIIRLFWYAVLTWSLVGVFVRVADFVVLFFVRVGTRSCEDDLDTSTVTRISVATMSYGQMSIDVRTDVSIVGSAQLSVNELGVSIDERMLLSIDVDLFSLRIMRSKSAGSEKNRIFSCCFWYCWTYT
ncbi:hypothetical protein F2Q70_00039516 [Brassica cretica]|uniref:Uncharacterized protein n=1 Tax=Brassica cretica TaxID=69181 RepID=A0A8S9K9R3_BRACR|nr:hypothetical protein F2Q70_00039516 [Brassica cretica]